MKKAALLLLPLLALSITSIPAARADDLLDIQNQIDQKASQYYQTQSNLDRIKKSIASLSSQIYATEPAAEEANKKVAEISSQLAQVEADLNSKKDSLRSIVEVRDQQIRQFYKYPGDSPLELFLTTDGFSNFTQVSGFQKRVLETSKGLIESINKEVLAMDAIRKDIAKTKADLVAIADSINSQLAALRGSYSYNSYQKGALSNKLTGLQNALQNLTAKQQEILAAKFAAAGNNQTVGDNAPPSEPLPDPGFSPAYVFLTYGYPHRVGMSQYGAYGRALAGQNYQTILQSYYNNIGIGGYPTPSSINVSGYGAISFEDNYLKGISEMPTSWSMEALKAQAVAARTYALAYTGWSGYIGNEGTYLSQRSICPTTSCQVYNPGHVSSRWNQAVNETRGIVITYGGAPITAYYASTAGGYTMLPTEVGWSNNPPYLKKVRDFGPNGAYEGPAYGNSPWYHTFWNGKYCSGTFPWLTKDEVTDLFNAALLSEASSNYNQYLSPNPSCFGAPGWDSNQVVGELQRIGKAPVGTLVNGGILVTPDGVGNTSSITFVSSNYPSGKTFSGSFFRSIFNIRSLGKLVILTSLYDVVIR